MGDDIIDMGDDSIDMGYLVTLRGGCRCVAGHADLTLRSSDVQSRQGGAG